LEDWDPRDASQRIDEFHILGRHHIMLLQRVAACRRVLQGVAGCCRVL